jgi:hypothetical protein
LQRQPQLLAGTLHFKLDGFAGLHHRRQHQVEHLPANFDLRAAIGGRADDPGIDHLPRLQSQRLQRPGSGCCDKLGQFRGDRHGVPALNRTMRQPILARMQHPMIPCCWET